MRTALATALSAILLTGLSGCKKDGEPSEDQKKDTQALHDLGMAAHRFNDSLNRLPKDKDEFEKALPNLEVPDAAQQALKSGRVVIVYGGLPLVQVANMPEGTSGTVLGYASYVPDKGGPVLFADGAVKNLSADEFKKAPQAKK